MAEPRGSRRGHDPNRSHLPQMSAAARPPKSLISGGSPETTHACLSKVNSNPFSMAPLSFGNCPQVAQSQGASSYKTAWCALGRVWLLLLAAPRASNSHAGRQREFPCAFYLQASHLRFQALTI